MASGPITSWQWIGNQWKQWQTVFSWAPKTADGDCKNRVERHLLLGRKAMTNLESVLKSRYLTFLTKICPAKTIFFLLVMYGYESWTIKRAANWRIHAFNLCCWRKVLRVPWTAKRSNQSILKDINLEYSLEILMLKLRLQYFGYLMQRADCLGKTLMLGQIKSGRRRGC